VLELVDRHGLGPCGVKPMRVRLSPAAPVRIFQLKNMNNQSFSKIWVMLIVVILLGGGILGWQYWWLPKEEIRMSEIKKPEIPTKNTITLVGKYSFVGNPCTTKPCLPGMVHSVLVDNKYYYLTINRHLIWEELTWEGYKPLGGDTVTIEGYLSEKVDIFNNPFYTIEIISLKKAK